MACSPFQTCALRILLALGVLLPAARATEWPHWRGPDRNGISVEKYWLTAWPAAGPAILWKGSVGLGFSSVTVSAGRLYTLGHASGQDTVFCLDATTGREIWKHSYPAELGDKFYEGGTTGTPTVDHDRVYTLSRWGDAFCFEAATGKILWNKNVQTETGARLPDWGFAGSPTIHENTLLLNVGEDGLALDKASGKILWKSSDKPSGYSTPLLWRRDGRLEIALASGQCYVGVDPASGKESWRMKWVTQYGLNAADPVPIADRLFISSGYGKGGALIKPVAGGEPEVIWKTKLLRTQFNSAILFEKYLYGVDGDTTDKPVLKCLDASDGSVKWSDNANAIRSFIIANGHFIALGDKGELILAPARSDAFQPTARFQALGGKCWTAPVLANGLLYCRNLRGDLVCIDLRVPTP